MNKKIFLSHSGKQHSYHVAKSLMELECLEKFYTSSYIRQKWLQDLLLKKNDTFWSRRFLKGLSGKYVESNWRFEIKELLYARLYGRSEKTQRAVYQRDVSFDKYISSKIPKSSADIFWGFQGSCYESLKSTKNSGKLSVCELATAHVEAAKSVLGEEKHLHPEWADSIDNLVFPTEYEKRLQEEPHIADKVLAASEFTKQSLLSAGVEKAKILTLPLGCDISHIPFSQNKKARKNRPLKILFAGRITQRKGIKYLLEAIRRFDKREVELHIIGYIHGKGDALKNYNGYFQLHPPVSQQELFRLYSEYDVLAIPSVFEGFGLVIVEAMAAGLPVITTSNTMGPDIVDNDKNGYIVSIRSVREIEDAIIKLLEKPDDKYFEMRKSARNAATSYSWEAYKGRLDQVLKKF